jgi:hypothetical protein
MAKRTSTNQAKGKARVRDAKGRFVMAPKPKAIPEAVLQRCGWMWVPLEPKQPSILSRQHYAVVSNDWWGEGRSPAQKE